MDGLLSNSTGHAMTERIELTEGSDVSKGSD